MKLLIIKDWEEYTIYVSTRGFDATIRWRDDQQQIQLKQFVLDTVTADGVDLMVTVKGVLQRSIVAPRFIGSFHIYEDEETGRTLKFVR